MIVLLVFAAAACSIGGRDGQPAVPVSRPPVPASGEVLVAAGDTVYDISRRYGLGMRQIIEENRLEPPFWLRVGQRLRLPPPASYRVKTGDTIYSIARRFAVDRWSLLTMNRIVAPYQITAGQILKLPASRVAAPGSATDPSTTRAVDGNATGKIVRGVSGGAPPLPMPRPRIAKSGQQVQPAARTAARTTPKQAKPFRLARPPGRASTRFLWPVRGRVISNFGPRDGGLHNDGINIAAPRGAPILAAENGVVAYAGGRLRGFGNLLLVKHDGGWITAYAHADRLLVRRGDLVKRGQAIATIGVSGGVTRPQLHFELRRGTEAVDPRGQLET